MEYVNDVKLIQSMLVHQTNETPGIRDEGGIVFSSAKILEMRNQRKHPFDIAAVIYIEFARKHYFHEANKRIASLLADAELLEAGYLTNYDAKKDGKFVREISAYNSSVTKTQIRRWLKSRAKQISAQHRKKYKQAYLLQ